MKNIFAIQIGKTIISKGVNYFNQMTFKIAIAVVLTEWLQDEGMITGSFIRVDLKQYSVITATEKVSQDWKNLVSQ